MEVITKLIQKLLSCHIGQTEKEGLDAWTSLKGGNLEELNNRATAPNVAEVLGERDDKFYEGLRTIQGRIEVIKRRRKRFRSYVKLVVLLILTAVFVATGSLLNKPPISTVMRTDKSASGTLEISLTENIVLEAASLGYVLKLLESEYNVEFSVSDAELLSSKFTGTFSRGTTMEEALRTLGQSGNFTYTLRTARTFELNSGDAMAD